MAHVSAALTPIHRLRPARLIVDAGWTPARAAEFFNVTWRTADKWAHRYRAEGPAGMVDRSSARHTQHARTPQPVVRKIVHLRWKQRLGPVPIATKLGMPASTVHAVLKRCRLNRLTHIDRSSSRRSTRTERPTWTTASRCRATWRSMLRRAQRSSRAASSRVRSSVPAAAALGVAMSVVVSMRHLRTEGVPERSPGGEFVGRTPPDVGGTPRGRGYASGDDLRRQATNEKHLGRFLRRRRAAPRMGSDPR